MSTTTPQSAKAAPKPGAAKPRKAKPAAAAAREETKPAAKAVEFRGQTIELPESLPATLLFHITELEASDNVMVVFRLLRDLLGPDQFAAVRDLIKPDDEVVVVVDSLLSDVFAQYGLDVGEPAASPSS